jgi:flagellar biosynthesis protein FliQ
MTPDLAAQVIRENLVTALWMIAPLLLIGFVAGILTSLVQIVTSIQDSAFSTIPRLLAFAGGFILLLPWMISRMMSYTEALIGNLGRYAH